MATKSELYNVKEFFFINVMGGHIIYLFTVILPPTKYHAGDQVLIEGNFFLEILKIKLRRL
jgi:hypothetical protein